MTKINRRHFMKSAAMVAAGTALSGHWISKAMAAEHVLKYANNLPLTHPMNIRAKEAAKRIQEQTSGAVKIEIYPNNVLGGDTQMLGQLRAGGIQFFTLSGLILSTLVPDAALSGVGFAFPNYNTVWSAMDGDLGHYIRNAIAQRGLYAFPKIWDNGYREITSSTKPIENPSDLHGFKIRVPISPLWTSLFKDLQASPTGINFSQVYTSLQTKVVDGQENPLAIIETAKLYEVQKYCSQTNHMWDGFWFLANQDTWNSLPEKYRTIIQNNFDQAGMDERTDVKSLNDSLRNKLQDQGLAFNTPDPHAFQAVLKDSGFYKHWQEKFGSQAWSILEKYSGSLS